MSVANIVSAAVAAFAPAPKAEAKAARSNARKAVFYNGSAAAGYTFYARAGTGRGNRVAIASVTGAAGTFVVTPLPGGPVATAAEFSAGSLGAARSALLGLLGATPVAAPAPAARVSVVAPGAPATPLAFRPVVVAPKAKRVARKALKRAAPKG